MEIGKALLLPLKQQQWIQEKLRDLEREGPGTTISIFTILLWMQREEICPNSLNVYSKMNVLCRQTQIFRSRKHTGHLLKNQYNTKEMILRKAWQKKIKHGTRILSFDHDYAHEVIQRCKSPMDNGLQQCGWGCTGHEEDGIQYRGRGENGLNSITSERQLQHVLTWRRVGGERNSARAEG